MCINLRILLELKLRGFLKGDGMGEKTEIKLPLNYEIRVEKQVCGCKDKYLIITDATGTELGKYWLVEEASCISV